MVLIKGLQVLTKLEGAGFVIAVVVVVTLVVDVVIVVDIVMVVELMVVIDDVIVVVIIMNIVVADGRLNADAAAARQDVSVVVRVLLTDGHCGDGEDKDGCGATESEPVLNGAGREAR